MDTHLHGFTFLYRFPIDKSLDLDRSRSVMGFMKWNLYLICYNYNEGSEILTRSQIHK